MFYKPTTLIVILIVSNFAQAKKLKIHRCVLSNGTIAFQETKCKKNKLANQKTKIITPQKTQNKTNKVVKPTNKSEQNTRKSYIKPKPVKYQKLENISSSGHSRRIISDQVKSYNISLSGLKKWGLFKRVYNNKLLHIKFLNDQAGEEMKLRIDFIFPDNKKFTEDELTELVYLVGSQFTNSSREGTVIPEKMNINNGKGVMATFTELNQNAEYKYTTKGAVFKGKWLIQFTLLSMNTNSFSHQFALQKLFNSINITQ